MKAWLSEYASQIIDLQKGRMKASPLKVSTHKAIEKLITTQWDQGEATDTGDAYNQLCPTISGKHCFTGCAATAMAQVMRYHQWPTNYCSQIPAYTPNEKLGQLKALPRLKFDWNNMLDRYDEGQSANECKAVAQLMQYCSHSLKMDFGTSSSSAALIDVAALAKDLKQIAPAEGKEIMDPFVAALAQLGGLELELEESQGLLTGELFTL